MDVHPQSFLWLIALAGLALAMLCCASAVGGWRRERLLHQRLLRLQETAASERERRAKRARLHVSLEQHVEISWNLTISNQGPAPADGITISINGTPVESSPLILSEKLGKLDVAIAGNGQLRIPFMGSERPTGLVGGGYMVRLVRRYRLQ